MMDISEAIEKLSLVDDLEKWAEVSASLPVKSKRYLYEKAERQWIKRKLEDGSLLVHPKVKDELIQREFSPLTKHRKMIWASVLVSYEGPDSKERFNRIKTKIIKKYNNQWWFEVYKRVQPTYAARKRLLEQRCFTPKAVKFASTRSMFFGNLVSEATQEILKTIPEN
jgi:hypothetical protein|tara:strand:- start:1725 stop:2228 length:504 start_codon:yes stop_codon:yes gene_type:complete